MKGGEEGWLHIKKDDIINREKNGVTKKKEKKTIMRRGIKRPTP